MTTTSGRTLANSPRLRLFVLCSMYLAQGVPWGFCAITLVAWLAERGHTTAEIGQLMALATLPWSFKWAWGPVLDALPLPGGRRRPWIILAEAAMALTMLGMALLPDPNTELQLLGWLIFLHNCFNAMQDVAVDALAVDLLDETERGRANGLMYGSKYLGGAIGGAGMASVVAAFGMRTAMVSQAVLLFAIMLLPLLVREGQRVGVTAVAGVDAGLQRALALLANLRRAFSLRTPLLGALLAVSIQLGIGVLSTIAPVLFTKTLGWSMERYAHVTGFWGVFVGLGGAVGGGLIADRVGHRRMIAIASTILGLTWLGFAWLQSLWQVDAFVIAVLMLETLCGALISVGLFALYMDISWPRVAATQFTAYMALLNLSTTLGHKFAGVMDGVWDIPQTYALAGVVQIVVIGLLLRMDTGQTRRELGSD